MQSQLHPRHSWLKGFLGYYLFPFVLFVAAAVILAVWLPSSQPDSFRIEPKPSESLAMLNTIFQFLTNSKWQFWTLLLVAGAFEITMATALKRSNGLTRRRASIIGFGAANLSILFLDLAARYAPISVAYPLWTGMGAFGSLAITRFWDKKRMKEYQPMFVAFLITGILGLGFWLNSPSEPSAPNKALGLPIMPMAAVLGLATLLGYALPVLLRLLRQFHLSKFQFWAYILIAGTCECIMALALKASDGWTVFWPSVLGIFANNLSIRFLTIASVRVEMSVAYPIWTGLGAVGSAALAVVLLGESASPVGIASWTCTIIGLLGFAFYDE